LQSEIQFFNSNTDGLVVDVMRNPGGSGCYTRSVLQLLIPTRFTFAREQIRATLLYINNFQTLVELSQLIGDQASLAAYTNILNELKAAYAADRGLTAPVSVCGTSAEVDPLISGGQLVAYTKPLIVLTDEFSFSAADVFAAAIQDNSRGKIVGMPTAGAGGAVLGSYTTGFYSESYATTTASLLVRRGPVSYPGLPSTPYIENIGVRPEIFLDSQTPQNLTDGYRTFVSDFTGAIYGILLGQ
jgi:C-terminal processing protease CtpA/Prc